MNFTLSELQKMYIDCNDKSTCETCIALVKCKMDIDQRELLLAQDLLELNPKYIQSVPPESDM